MLILIVSILLIIIILSVVIFLYYKNTLSLTNKTQQSEQSEQSEQSQQPQQQTELQQTQQQIQQTQQQTQQTQQQTQQTQQQTPQTQQQTQQLEQTPQTQQQTQQLEQTPQTQQQTEQTEQIHQSEQTPQQKVEDIASSVSQTKINCSNISFDEFCMSPVLKLNECPNSITSERAFEDTKKCRLQEKISKEQYNKALLYFNNLTPSLKLPDLPPDDINCKNYNNLCDDPESYIKYCDPIMRPEFTIQQQFDLTKNCGLTDKTPIDKWKNVQQYFKEINPSLTLPDKSDVDCKNENFDYFCQNPTSHLKYCKPLKPLSNQSTDDSDLYNVKMCIGKIPNEQWKNAQQYFLNKSPSLKLPDLPPSNINCNEIDSFCKYPIDTLNYCKPFQSSPTTDQFDLNRIKNCAINTTLTSNIEYNNSINYFKQKGLELTKLADDTCYDLNNLCISPTSWLQNCKGSVYNISRVNSAALVTGKNPNRNNNSDQDDLSFIQNCGIDFKTSELEYNKAKDYFKDKGLILPDKPDVNCLDPNINLCDKPVSFLAYCKSKLGIKGAPDQDLKNVAICGIDGKTSDIEYNKAKIYFKDNFNLTLQDKPEVNCDLPESYCKNPASFLSSCKVKFNPTDDKQDLYNVQTSCGVTRKTSPEQWARAKDYFAKKNLSLMDLPAVDCFSSTSFCEDPAAYLQGCKVPGMFSYKYTDEDDKQHTVECMMSEPKISKDSYNKAKDYFAKKNIQLPNYISSDCSSCNTLKYFCSNISDCLNCEASRNEGGINNPTIISLTTASDQCYYQNSTGVLNNWSELSNKYPKYFTNEKLLAYQKLSNPPIDCKLQFNTPDYKQCIWSRLDADDKVIENSKEWLKNNTSIDPNNISPKTDDEIDILIKNGWSFNLLQTGTISEPAKNGGECNTTKIVSCPLPLITPIPNNYLQGDCPRGYYDSTKGKTNKWGCAYNCPGGLSDDSCNCACIKNNIDLSALPPNGYSQNQCNTGYYDSTRGKLNNWECGLNCKGGKYLTDDKCNCACIPNSSSSTISSPLNCVVEWPDLIPILSNDNIPPGAIYNADGTINWKLTPPIDWNKQLGTYKGCKKEEDGIWRLKQEGKILAPASLPDTKSGLPGGICNSTRTIECPDPDDLNCKVKWPEIIPLLENPHPGAIYNEDGTINWEKSPPVDWSKENGTYEGCYKGDDGKWYLYQFSNDIISQAKPGGVCIQERTIECPTPQPIDCIQEEPDDIKEIKKTIRLDPNETMGKGSCIFEKDGVSQYLMNGTSMVYSKKIIKGDMFEGKQCEYVNYITCPPQIIQSLGPVEKFSFYEEKNKDKNSLFFKILIIILIIILWKIIKATTIKKL